MVENYTPREHNDEETHVHPAEETELRLEIALLQRHHEAHKSNDIEGEADHAMVGGEWEELGVREHNMLA